MGCCDLALFWDGAQLICKDCQRPVRKTRRANRDRCIVKYTCDRCGREKVANCGVTMRVFAKGGSTVVKVE